MKLPSVFEHLNFDDNMWCNNSFEVVFPLDPVIPIIFNFDKLLHFFANVSIVLMFDEVLMILSLFSFLSLKLASAPFARHDCIKSWPSTSFPFIGIKISFSLIFLESIVNAFISLILFLLKF